MSRVSAESLEKLIAFIDSLGDECRNKCALCTETLTHITKTAEAQTGAGTATVTRVLADKINETAAPMDKVSGESLRGRVRQKENDRNLSGHNDQINNPNTARREFSQKTIWKRAVEKLDSLCKEMTEKCRAPAKINKSTILKLETCITTLNYFLNDLKGGIQT